MNPRITGPIDTALLLLAAATKTATFSTTALDLGSGWAPGNGGVPMQAIIPSTIADHTTGDETYSLQIEESDDNSTFTAAGVARTFAGEITAGNVAYATGGTILLGAFVSKRYVRLTGTIGGTTPSIALGDCYLQPVVNALG